MIQTHRTTSTPAASRNVVADAGMRSGLPDAMPKRQTRGAIGLLAAIAFSGAFAVLPARAADGAGPQGSEPGASREATENNSGNQDRNANPGELPEALLGIEPRGDGENASKPSFHKALEDGFPDTPKKRRKVLANLYAHLAAAPDAETANQVALVIERIWVTPGSDTVSVLMERAAGALNERNTTLAIKLLDAVVALAPDYAEGWNRRALGYYMAGDFARSMGDLRRVLALEPNHFKALQGLAQILKDKGQEKGALKAYRQLLDIHPFAEGGEDALREVERNVEGQGI